MCPEPSDQPRSIAIEQLKAFGLSTYAAQTFVALVSLGDGTAQDVSDVSDVPRTRVYDAAAELSDRGFIDVQQSTPKRFAPISAETTGRRLHREFTHRTNVLTDALDNIEPVSRSDEQRGVWTVTGRDSITDRTVEFINTATDEVVFMTVKELLVEECIDALRAAAARGVTIQLAGLSTDVQAELQHVIPEAEVFESIWDWSAMPAGRILMVDQQKTLASVLETSNDEPGSFRNETAIWGTGETNSLVMVLKALFTWQLDGTRSE